MIAAAADIIRGIARLFPAWVWTALVGLMACIVVAHVSYLNGQADERARAALRTAEANAAARATDAAAKDAASAERLADALENDANQKELLDAVKALPDARPSDRRVALACERLRQQGTRDANLPARCRSGG